MTLPSLYQNPPVFVGLLALAAFSLTSFASAAERDVAPAEAVSVSNSSKADNRPVNIENDKTLYMVGYAHLDTQWRWTYQDTIKNFIPNTMRMNFVLFKKYPDYVFNFTGARRYEFMKEYYPEDYAEVKKYVSEGRWFPAGSSVEETDQNIPGLESIVRNYLYGNHFFEKEFGVHGEDYMMPDSFGFPSSLPEILVHGGIKGFSTCKLGYRVQGIPFNIGRWIGANGTSIVAALNPQEYTSAVGSDLSSDEFSLKRIDENGKKAGANVDYRYYGTGDQGGAPKAPSVSWMERSIAGKGPIRVLASRSDQMFKDLTPEAAAKLPSFQGELELNEHSSGSATSQAYIKRWNRKNEQLASAAETAAVTASWINAFPYPYGPLYQAWLLVIGSQMHDNLAGTTIPEGFNYIWNDEIVAANTFSGIEEKSVAAVVSAMDTKTKGTPIAVYNPLAIEREDLVEATIPGINAKEVTAYDPQGNPVATQVLGHENGAIRVLFAAKVPSAGFAVYDLRPGAGKTAKSTLTVSDNSLENAHYRVRLDKAGDIVSIFDKTLDRELLSAPVRLSFHGEFPKNNSAWNMDWTDRQKPARGYVDGPAKISIVESGPARIALEVERSAENSNFKQQIRLSEGSAGDRVEIYNKIDWRSQECCLKSGFSFTASNALASFDDKVGVTIRKTNSPEQYEMPVQQWMDLTAADGSFGVAILNDGKFGSDKPDDHTLRLTLLYTPKVRNVFHDQATQDQGRHEMVYAIASHKGDWAQAGVPWQADRLNQPLRAFLPQAHAGALGRTFSLMGLNSEQVKIVAVKKAEASDEVIVRLKELTGKPAPDLKLHFASAINGAREVNGQEQPIGDAVVKGGALAFSMKPFSLRAFALKLAPAPAAVPAIVSKPLPLPYDLNVASTNANRQAGAMNERKESYPSELFPKTLKREGVEFQLGPTAPGQNNALVAAGQQITFPKGDFNRVHLLAAAVEDTSAELKIGEENKPFFVPSWTGYVGQWDNRLWHPSFPDLINVGLVPGFIKRTPIAWFATHHHKTDGDAFYEFSYLFQFSYDLAPGTQTIVLPENRKIRILAISVSKEPGATPPAAPLYDTLEDHQTGGLPVITQAGGSFQGPIKIELLPPLYYRVGELHYTLDGTEPTKDSPVYTGPFDGNDNVNIAVREIKENGEAGPVVRGKIEINDRTAPQVADILVKAGKLMEVKFSKAMNRESASATGSYVISPALPIASVSLSQDGRVASLALGKSMEPGVDYTLSVKGAKDATRNSNLSDEAAVPFNTGNIIYQFAQGKFPEAKCKVELPKLPREGRDAWSMNVFIKPQAKPADGAQSIGIVGFGKNTETDVTGGGRFLVIAPDGIRFMGVRRDVITNTPVDLGSWQMLTVTYDGRQIAIYKNGEPIKKQDFALSALEEASVLVGERFQPSSEKTVFEGDIRDFTLRQVTLPDGEVKALFDQLKPTVQP